MGRRRVSAPATTSGCTKAGNEHVANKGGERPPGSKRSARRAALYCRICSALDNNSRQQDRVPHPHASFTPQLRQFHKVRYEDAKTWMERKLAGMKSGVPNWVATAMAGEWAGGLGDDITDPDRGIAEIEAVNLAKHYKQWHVPWLGHMENLRTDGVFCILGVQLNASSLEVRTQKVADVVRLINDWEIQAGCFLEVGVNRSSYPSLVNLASWFCDEIQDIRTHTAHNKHENVAHHQPGGTATFACKELVRYAKERTSNHRGQGRWCLTLFYANPNHKFRLVSAYNVGRQRPRGGSTIYQQQVQYIQPIRDSQLCFLRFDSIRTQPCACWMAALTITGKPTGFYNRIYKGMAFLFVN
jgi:hypothetical protein